MGTVDLYYRRLPSEVLREVVAEPVVFVNRLLQQIQNRLVHDELRVNRRVVASWMKMWLWKKLSIRQKKITNMDYHRKQFAN